MKGRDYRGAIAGLEGAEVGYLSASEITRRLAQGEAHFGITGEDLVREEIAESRRLFTKYGWPVIDVTRRSIEETAAAIIDLYKEHRLKFIAES